MLQEILPADAICCVAVTMIDLWPGEGWNYVFGEAYLEHHVGVFSFARYHPSFPEDFNPEAKPISPVLQKLVLLRSLKVMVHECVHMLQIPHCIHFHCLMNGANTLEESDAGPLFMCPCCLRKLKHSIGPTFDTRKRYEKLLEFFLEHGLVSEVNWTQKRLYGD